MIRVRPRGFCAGVVRAVDIVELALQAYGPPVYVHHEIVHNRYVVEQLRQNGAIFVETVEEVPLGSVLVFSAHGVPPTTREEARTSRVARDRRDVPAGDQGASRSAEIRAREPHDHPDRPPRSPGNRGDVGRSAETDGGGGQRRSGGRARSEGRESPGVSDPDDTEPVRHAGNCQRGCARGFPSIEGPASDDICYATQNRQEAVEQLAREVDLILVVGSPNSSNSNRLVEVAKRSGVAAELIDAAKDIDPKWLEGIRRVGLTAGASAPEVLVEQVSEHLAGLGYTNQRDLDLIREDVRFTLPSELTTIAPASN